MSANIDIIRADQTNLEGVAKLFDLYRQFYGKDSEINSCQTFLKERMENNDIIIYAAFIDGEMAGITNIYPSFSSVSMVPFWILNDLYVDEKYRGRGVAEALLNHAKHEAKKAGALQLQLETAPDNKAAQSVYERCGWVQNTYKFYNRSTD